MVILPTGNKKLFESVRPSKKKRHSYVFSYLKHKTNKERKRRSSFTPLEKDSVRCSLYKGANVPLSRERDFLPKADPPQAGMPRRGFLTGFTLLELIVTVVILSSGIIFVYKGFFTSLNVSSYAKHYLYAQLWMEEKLQDIKGEFRRYKAPFIPQVSGSFKEESKSFFWKVSYCFLESTDKMSLYNITLRVSWKEGIRNIRLVRAAYIHYNKKLR